MFDMGFLELLLIGIIALIVLGPERLPKAARTVGLWVAKAKQGFESVKVEIDRELKVQELQQQIKEQKAKIEKDVGFDQLKSSITETQSFLEDNANSILNESNTISNQIKNDMKEKSNVDSDVTDGNIEPAKLDSAEGKQHD
ncbi:MAG: twin-arginine translocase subunit TatB [Kangiella sp.]|nr:MAG: twin-arginine translocase subunit TatB [Kangiella sp.]